MAKRKTAKQAGMKVYSDKELIIMRRVSNTIDAMCYRLKQQVMAVVDEILEQEQRRDDHVRDSRS